MPASHTETVSRSPANWAAAILAVSSLLFCAVGIARSYTSIPLRDDWKGIFEFALDVRHGKIGAWWLPLYDLILAVPSEQTALIQHIHITAARAICHLVERELFNNTSELRTIC